jgi:hypothetical protein
MTMSAKKKASEPVQLAGFIEPEPTIGDALKEIVGLLVTYSPEEQARILRAATILLGLDRPPPLKTLDEIAAKVLREQRPSPMPLLPGEKW